MRQLKLWPTDDAGRARPSPASSGGSTTEPDYEPLFDDLPWEEPTFDNSRVPDGEEAELEAAVRTEELDSTGDKGMSDGE